ncbi:MAG: beta-N-acetylglucosaminidase domain-containing protein [Acidobacteria bacterium]|nr:beta-N-acetylglucosaminidase domain-containing protein [Acidobacteriota bacterium]
MKTIHTRPIDVNPDRWLGAVEGYYGPPLPDEERLALVEWLGAHGFNAFAYAPKDDPYHRQRWREPYPPERRARLAELVRAGEAAGVAVALVVSPGLDWKEGDEDPLAAKLASFAEDGATVLGVAFDDVPPGGADLGAAHAAGVAAAVARLGTGVRWVTCPTDYATDRATDYLRAFAAGLPDGVDVMWTGPSIVSPAVDGALASRLAKDLGRPLLFAENYPVNDGPMSGVLHLGPYRGRAPDLPASTTGVFFNIMSLPRASRVALAAGVRFWRDPGVDPESAWRDVLAEFPGIERLARASRSWIADPAPDPEVAALVRAALEGDPTRLTAFVDADPRAGLDPLLAAEVTPWLDQWDAEALAMRFALLLLGAEPAQHTELSFVVAEAWARARHSRLQLFGIRWAYYPVTERRGGRTAPRPDALVTGSNLTDVLCAEALARAAAE